MQTGRLRRKEGYKEENRNENGSNKKKLGKNGVDIAVVNSEEYVITDVQSALDLIMNLKYETGCTNIAINKEAVIDDFFVLSTCLAGEIHLAILVMIWRKRRKKNLDHVFSLDHRQKWYR